MMQSLKNAKSVKKSNKSDQQNNFLTKKCKSLCNAKIIHIGRQAYQIYSYFILKKSKIIDGILKNSQKKIPDEDRRKKRVNCMKQNLCIHFQESFVI